MRIGCQRSLSRPSLVYAGGQGISINTQKRSPLHDVHSATTESEHMVGSSIIGLFLHGCPSAIHIPTIVRTFRTLAARIVTVIISSLDRVTRSPRSNHLVRAVLL